MDRNSVLGHTICGQLDGEQPKVRVAAFNIVVCQCVSTNGIKEWRKQNKLADHSSSVQGKHVQCTTTTASS